MTEPEGFLSRWSRLKRDLAAAADAHAPDEASANEDREHPPEDEKDNSVASSVDKDDTAPALPSIDLSKLPPIESITATTDIRAFLAPGVPLELSRAALRRAWVADPNIRTFIGIAENQWDFTAPESIPGFGSLTAVDDVRKLLADVFGESSQHPDAEASAQSHCPAAAAAQPVGEPEESAECEIAQDALSAAGDDESAPALVAGPNKDEVLGTPVSDVVQHSESDVATHCTSRDHADVIPSRARRHGGALPE
jgi:Protein of unknown function (DUF3306)